MESGKANFTRIAVCCLVLLASIPWNHAAVVDIKTKGAKGDGKTDDGPAIVSAWKAACAGPAPATVLIPAGTYMAHPPINLDGPCKGAIEIKATGATLKAPPEISKFNTDTWIGIRHIDKLTMTGGTFDGQGQQTWKSHKCSDSLSNCQIPVNLRFSHLKDAVIQNVASLNSKYFHINLLGCNNTRLDNVTVDAPGNSVNTDGIHIGRLNGLNITNSRVKTGDDCISFGDGAKNVHLDKVTCGPGHGISVGSLGKYANEGPVEGIFVKNCTLTGTDNGVRIKSWPASYPGAATDIHFEDIIMDKVANPVLIDQEYCPGSTCKKGGPSKVKISNVSFRKIKGTSTTKVAIKLACSPGVPCENVELADINLSFKGVGGPATSECDNIKPKIVGQVVPATCPAGAAKLPKPPLVGAGKPPSAQKPPVGAKPPVGKKPPIVKKPPGKPKQTQV